MKKQFWITIGLLCFMVLYMKQSGSVKAVPLPGSLVDFPTRINSSVMTSSSRFDEAVMDKLGVDEYINREYHDEENYPISLYLGYYNRQSEGRMIHSPRNCMPGSGWNPVKSDTVSIQNATTKNIYKVNRIIFQKGMDKISMLYWYHGRNRIVANEYVDRFFLIVDSILKKRSEGALVRIIGPWNSGGNSDRKLEDFAAELLPVLQHNLPQ